MGIFSRKPKGDGLMDVIRCDESSYLIWKWRPDGAQTGGSRRENAIRWGSSLRVKEGSVAVFVYTQADGTRQDFIEGPFDGIIETGNLPILANIIGLAYQGDTPFQAEVYFINLAQVIQVKFGVPFFDVFDPRYPDFGVPAAVRGTITFRIEDYRNFVRLHGLSEFDIESFRQKIKSAVVRITKGVVANAPSKHGIPALQVESRMTEINDLAEREIRRRLEEVFGVVVTAVDIEAIELDRQSDGYRRLMEVTRDLASASAQAKARAEIKNVEDMQRINAENLEESLRIQREEDRYAQRLQTTESHMDAFRATSQADVAMAGAESLGKLGSSGGDSVHDAFSPAGMMAGVAMSGTVARGMAELMSDMMGSVTHPTQTPPPLPEATYYVVLDGQSTGPYSVGQLKEIVSSGQLDSQTYVWTQGMANWEMAGEVKDLSSLFGHNRAQTPPPIPPEAKS